MKAEEFTTKGDRQPVAVASNLPIEDLETARKHYKKLAAEQGKRVRIVFRGPRRGMTKISTRKEDATGFSVYFV